MGIANLPKDKNEGRNV